MFINTLTIYSVSNSTNKKLIFKLCLIKLNSPTLYGQYAYVSYSCFYLGGRESLFLQKV